MKQNFSNSHQNIDSEFDPYGGVLKQQDMPLKGYKAPQFNQSSNNNNYKNNNSDRLQYQPQQQHKHKKNKNNYKHRDQQPTFERNNQNNNNYYEPKPIQNTSEVPYSNQNYPPQPFPNPPSEFSPNINTSNNIRPPYQPYENNSSQNQEYNEWNSDYEQRILPKSLIISQEPNYIMPQNPQVQNNQPNNYNNIPNDGFSEIRPQQQQQQQVNQTQNLDSFTVEIKQQRDSTQQKFNITQQLLGKIFGQADFEIKISNIGPQLSTQIDFIIKELEQYNFRVICSNLNEDEVLLKQRIYQLKGCQDIGLSQQDHMVYVYLYQIVNLIQKAENLKLRLLISAPKQQFKINPGQQTSENQATQFFNFFKSQIDQTIILFDECKTKSEARIKTLILNSSRMKENLSKLLNLKNILLFPSFDLPINDLAPQLGPFAEQIIEKAPNIVLIGMSQATSAILELQKQFQSFTKQKENIRFLQDTSQLTLSFPPDQNQIDQEIEYLHNQQNFEIIVTPPQMDYTHGKFTVSIQISLWMEGYQHEQIGESKISDIKNKIKSIYLPIVEIQLTNEKQIKVWKNLLSEEFEKNTNSKECITKHCNDNLIIIELQGDSQTTQTKKEQIMNALKNYNYQYQSFNCDNQMLNLLSKKLSKKLFKNQLQKIADVLEVNLIRLMDVIKDNKLSFEIIYQPAKVKEQQIEEGIQELFIDKLEIQHFDPDFKQFLDFLKIKEQKFQEDYQIVFENQYQGKKGFAVVGLFESIEQVRSLVKQLQVALKNNLQTLTLTCVNKIVFNSIKQFVLQKQIELDDAQIVFTQDEKIMVTADKGKLQQIGHAIQSKINFVENQVIKSSLDFSEKEVKYISKNLQTIIEQFQKENEICVSYSTNSDKANQQFQKSLATRLSFEGKDLQIIFADISRIECDAIVNSCNDRLSFGDPTTLSGVAQSIFEMAGSQYHSFCEDYIKRFVKLKVGDAISYEMPKGKHIKYIINVATPIYSSGNQTNQDLTDIGRNIKAIFQEADSLQIQSLALPIFGGGACGYSFGQASDVVLREVINQLFSNKCKIKTVYITETMDSKISELQTNLQLLLQPSQKQRKIQYQWQWHDGSKFVDYDDEDINRQIDETYEKFQNTGIEQKCLLKFAFTKQPGTHTVDLQNMKLTDVALNKELSFNYKILNNSKKYFINNEQVDDQLNEYFMLQEMNQQSKFSLFYKRHQIVMNNQEMCQMNLETKYQRKIQAVKYIEKKQNQDNKLVLKDKKFILINSQYSKSVLVKNQKLQIFIEAFDGSLSRKFCDIIKKELQKVTMTYKLDVPAMPNEDLQNFEQFLQANSLQINGVIKQGQQLSLFIFEKKKQAIKSYVDKIKLSIRQYPLEWEQQDKNYQKVRLLPNSQEYKKIQNHFKLTENGIIYEIYRIQNKALWDNYSSEKKKLIELHKQQGYQLQKIEEERYLWHGVRQQHPKIIYEGVKEAFDQTYSNIGMWGPGIYFAENASYSRNYSYTLTNEDKDRVNIGRLVFLCCLVTTGKVEVRQPDNNIKRPSDGYDCVSGFTNGSNVFILYSMDIRRAYPAYEIIYQ